MNAVPGMPKTKAAADLLYALEVTRHVDILDVLDAAEELARSEGSRLVDGEHVRRALSALAGKEKTNA